MVLLPSLQDTKTNSTALGRLVEALVDIESDGD
jgi:hypothetical protein